MQTVPMFGLLQHCVGFCWDLLTVQCYFNCQRDVQRTQHGMGPCNNLGSCFNGSVGSTSTGYYASSLAAHILSTFVLLWTYPVTLTAIPWTGRALVFKDHNSLTLECMGSLCGKKVRHFSRYLRRHTQFKSSSPMLDKTAVYSIADRYLSLETRMIFLSNNKNTVIPTFVYPHTM